MFIHFVNINEFNLSLSHTLKIKYFFLSPNESD